MYLSFYFFRQSFIHICFSSAILIHLSTKCSDCSDWLHMQVTGSKNRFSKCNFKTFLVQKLQGPELSHLVYNIIWMSSTKVVHIMPIGSKLTCPGGHNFTLNDTANLACTKFMYVTTFALYRHDCLVPSNSLYNSSVFNLLVTEPVCYV